MSVDRSKEPIRIECRATGSFEQWLAASGGALAITTYQAGKVALVGWDGRQLTLLMRQFDKPLGLAGDGDLLALATRHEITLFANAPLLASEYLPDQPGRYDALYLPRVTYQTGDLNTHDVAFCGGQVLLVNTRFSCVARVSDRYSFEPVWQPPFVTDLVPEDRCHLNGIAVLDGRPKWVTAHGATDTPGGWRPGKADGGVLVDMETNEIVLRGLSMPHSPRWHQGRLWLLNSGAGELLTWEPGTDRPEVVCVLPGYVRGLCFVGSYAVIGLSKIREKHIFGGLPIQQRFDRLQCGVVIVDLRSAAPIGMFEFTAGCEELYEVRFLPGVYRPMIVNLERSAAREAFTNPDSSFWLRPGTDSGREQPGDSNRPMQQTPAPGADQISGQAGLGRYLPDSGVQL